MIGKRNDSLGISDVEDKTIENEKIDLVSDFHRNLDSIILLDFLMIFFNKIDVLKKK